MLEVQHTSQSIGCRLSLHCAGGEAEHLLLSSKPVCKRIIRAQSALSDLTICIDQSGCSLKSLSLVALSPRFARSRLQQRLRHRGHASLASSDDMQTLYAAYRRHLHALVMPSRYRALPFLPDSDASLSIPAGESPRPRLLLVEEPDGSKVEDRTLVERGIEPAIEFARDRGWSVQYHDARTAQMSIAAMAGEPERFFMMPLSRSVSYRQDVFAQLLHACTSDTLLVYADHDHVGEDSLPTGPELKPEWNPDLLIHHDYIRTPWMIRADWLQAVFAQRQGSADSATLQHWLCSRTAQVLLSACLGVGAANDVSAGSGSTGFETSDSGAASADVGAGIGIEPLQTSQVRRVPIVLARLLGTPASDESVRWEQELRTALPHAGSKARLDETVRGRIIWPLPDPAATVSIIIPTRDQMAILKNCIDSIEQRTDYPEYRICIMDNDSRDEAARDYLSSLAEQAHIEVQPYHGAFNYSAINNKAVSSCDSDVVVLLNNDTEVISPYWLDELVRQAMRPEIGCVGAKLYYSNGRIQHGGVIVGMAGVAGHAHRYCVADSAGYCSRLQAVQNLTAVTAACLAIRRSTWLAVGGLDEQGLAVAWNDVDLCLKVQQLGYRNLWTPHAQLFHHEGLSRGADDTREKVQRASAEHRLMVERWQLQDFIDPAYHPLLSREDERFSLGDELA